MFTGQLTDTDSIIEKGLSSALVMEDDADWDVSFREQLERFALGSHYMTDTKVGSTPHSPYGDDWDLLWLGHCSNKPADDDLRRFIIENDPTTTPFNHRVNFGATPEAEMFLLPNNTRIMFQPQLGVCLYAYALSHRGAQKVIYYLSMLAYNEPVDYGIEAMCRLPERNFTCVGIFPQIVDSHRAAGIGTKDSDISDHGSETREKGFSFNVVYSTRLNVDRLMNGERENVTGQWPLEMPEVEGEMEMSWLPHGYMEGQE